MGKIVDFDKHKKNDGKSKNVDQTENAAFLDENINPSFVFDVIRDKKTLDAFSTMLLALRQISIDGEVTISIDGAGVRFDSSNSIETSDYIDGFQTNVSLTKQGYLFTTDLLGNDLPVSEISHSLGELLSSLVLFKEDDFSDDFSDDFDGDE